MALYTSNGLSSPARSSVRLSVALGMAAVFGLCGFALEARADAVTDWNIIAFNTMPPTLQGPPQARVLGYVQAAVFDAVNSVQRKYKFYAVDLKAPGASAEAAAVTAAHGILIRFFPAQKASLDGSLENSLKAISEGQSKSDGINVGRAVAEQIHAISTKDKADAPVPPYTPGTDPSAWQFTAPGMEPRGLTWGAITPFLLKSANQFAYPGPLKVGSAEYAKEVEEVRILGGAGSNRRTAEQTAVAIFWVVSMANVFNDVARTAAKVKGTSLIENARLFALLNLAASDSQIATWDQKFSTNFLRPVTAIRNAGKLGNPGITEDTEWTPLLVTPAHPDYPSGHCAYGGAGSKILQLFFETDTVDASYTFPPFGVTRRWTSYSQMAQEVGDARVWGGIHTRTADQDADMIGQKIAEYAFANFMRPVAEAK
jgi:hypothetical protein